ncbi:hypothetical protein J6590_066400 [Homalodisca vitripennis]|nr:hypothetical protein J6590_066400 [Homalodisca vitripennis]
MIAPESRREVTVGSSQETLSPPPSASSQFFRKPSLVLTGLVFSRFAAGVCTSWFRCGIAFSNYSRGISNRLATKNHATPASVSRSLSKNCGSDSPFPTSSLQATNHMKILTV